MSEEEIDLKVFKEQQELIKIWKEKYYQMKEERDKQKEVLDKIDKLINTDYGWVSYYYKYNNRYLKSEIKEDINKLLEEIE